MPCFSAKAVERGAAGCGRASAPRARCCRRGQRARAAASRALRRDGARAAHQRSAAPRRVPRRPPLRSPPRRWRRPAVVSKLPPRFLRRLLTESPNNSDLMRFHRLIPSANHSLCSDDTMVLKHAGWTPFSGVDACRALIIMETSAVAYLYGMLATNNTVGYEAEGRCDSTPKHMRHTAGFGNVLAVNMIDKSTMPSPGR